MRHAISTALLGLLLAGSARAADPFDPHSYIDNKEQQKSTKAAQLSGSAIYRINGQRFLKLVSPEGAVYLPDAGSMPEIREELAICQQYIRLLREVLLVRDNVPIEASVRKEQKAVVAMIRHCNEGKVRGPTVEEESPDGAVVEVKPKEHREPAQGNPNKD